MSEKRPSPVVGGLVGALLGFVLFFISAGIYGWLIMNNDPFLTAGEAGEKTGEALAPLFVAMIALGGFLGVRRARKNSSDR